MRNNYFFKIFSFVLFSIFLTSVVAHAASAKEPDQVERHKGKNGKINKWVFRQKGRVYKIEHDRNGDGKPDLRIFEERGFFVRKEYDDNFDGKFEKIEKRPEKKGALGPINAQ